jgi:antitoxin MazE
MNGYFDFIKMKGSIIKIGNSKGIIIPSEFLQILDLRERVKINIEGKKIVIEALNSRPRADWDKIFAKSNSKQNNDVFLSSVFEDESFEDWTW